MATATSTATKQTVRAKPGAGRPGLGARLGKAVAVVGAVVAELDPDRLSGADATALYGTFAEVDRLVVTAKALLAARIESSGVWQAGGHRDAAACLAQLEGVSPGQARRTLSVGERLGALPGTEALARRGTLSGPKLTALTEAGTADPAREGELLAGAEAETLTEVAERCRRVRSHAASADPAATLVAIHARRRFRSWTDPEGAFCYEGRDTPDRGAALLGVLATGAATLRRARRRAGEPAESDAALRADALYALLTRPGGSGGPGDGDGPTPPGAPLPAELGAVVDRPPRATVVVRVDVAAFLRGHPEPGERCELDGTGPVPVTMARALASDAFLALCFHRAGDIQAVTHLGRTVNRRLRTALVERDRACVVPGCGSTTALEIDHVVPLAEDGPTALDNLALLCHHHHFLKTYGGWTLARTGTTDTGRPSWSFTRDRPTRSDLPTPDPRPDPPEQTKARRRRRE